MRPSRNRRRRRRKDDEFWARPAMVPTTVGQAAGEHAARARRWRRLVKANFVAFPFAVLALLIVTAQLVTTTGAVREDHGGDTVPTVVRAEALDTVGDWLGSPGSPLPGARVLGWDGATRTAWPDVTEEKDRTYDVWVAYVLVSTDTALYRAGVQVNLGGAGASVVGTPSLELVPLAAGATTTGAPWPGTTAVSASDAVERAVTAWAQAYVSGDPGRLTTVVADPDTTHTYLPVPGFTGVRTTVNATAYHAYARGDEPDTSVLMVNVTLAVEHDGADKPAQVTLDLLVSDPTTGSARVTAWGAPGTGPALTPYANAVGQGGDAVAPTGTPGLTPAPTGTPGLTPAPTGTSTPTTPGPKES